MAALMGNDQEVMLAYVDRVVFKEVNPCVFLFLFVCVCVCVCVCGGGGGGDEERWRWRR